MLRQVMETMAAGCCSFITEWKNAVHFGKASLL